MREICHYLRKSFLLGNVKDEGISWSRNSRTRTNPDLFYATTVINHIRNVIH